MAGKTVAQKTHVKAGARIMVIHRVPGIIESLGLPEVGFVRSGEADLVFLFVKSLAELQNEMPSAVARLGSTSALWVFFKKGSQGAGLDMNRNSVWSAADRLGMRPLGLVSVNETWSAFRLRLASKAGKKKP